MYIEGMLAACDMTEGAVMHITWIASYLYKLHFHYRIMQEAEQEEGLNTTIPDGSATAV